MTTRMEVKQSETGLVRVFSVDLPPKAQDRFITRAETGEWPLKSALGADRLDPYFIDVLRLADLGEMTLSDYLAEGYGLPPTVLADDAARLNAQEGTVVILPSRAFDHHAQTLHVGGPLRWLGTWAETPAAPGGPALRSTSAQGDAPAAAPATSPTGQGRRALAWVMGLMVGLLVITIVLLILPEGRP